jgi:hypothetical protein
VSTGPVTLFGTACVICWVIAYFAIIYRGFADRTYGMPMPALVANLSWEAIYSFILDPFGDYIHVLSIPCFFIDLVIASQCVIYGPRWADTPLLRKYFRPVFFVALAITFPIVYLSFKEFRDPAGEYTGFGINFMMSILFIALLMRRPVPVGQSMYIAISKWLGTFFSYIATALTVTTSMAHPWPASFTAFVLGTVRSRAYPLTPLISVLYGVTFIVDIFYVLLLRDRLKENGMPLWRRL